VGDILPLPGDPMQLAGAAMARLHRLIAQFEIPSMPYLPVPDPDFLPAAGPYDHLSRRGEWTAVPA